MSLMLYVSNFKSLDPIKKEMGLHSETHQLSLNMYIIQHLRVFHFHTLTL